MGVGCERRGAGGWGDVVEGMGWGCTGYRKSMDFCSWFLYPISVFSELFSVPSKSSFHTVLQNQASGPAMVQRWRTRHGLHDLWWKVTQRKAPSPKVKYIWSEFNGFHMVQKCPDVFFGQCFFIGKTMMIISCGEVAYFQTNPHVAPHVAIEVFQVWTLIQMGLSKIIGVPKIRWFRASRSLLT